MVADISKTGARILAHTKNPPPDEFLLVMTRDGNVRHHCRVTWRADGEVGVEFVLAPKAFHASPPSASSPSRPSILIPEAPAAVVNRPDRHDRVDPIANDPQQTCRSLNWRRSVGSKRFSN